MALVSPGLQVTVTDQSQYVPATVGTVPLLILATAENKTISGSLATGTTKANAGALQSFGSQRDLITALGNPNFQTSAAGTPLHGNELNEYGLMTAYSALGLGNQLYAIRADVDLDSLQGTSVRPTGSVADGTFWFDIADTNWGIYEWSADTQSFIEQTPILVTTTGDTVNTTQGSLNNEPTPKSSIGQVGSYAVVTTTVNNRIYNKAGAGIGSIDPFSLNNTWVLLGTPHWHASRPVVIGNNTSPHLPNSGTFTINSTTVNLGSSGTYQTVANAAAAINSASITGVKADVINNQLALYTDGTSKSNGTVVDGGITLGNTAATVSAGLSAGTYNMIDVQYSTYAGVPAWQSQYATNKANGAVWIKTGAVGGGANFVFNEYNSVTAIWSAASGLGNIFSTEVAAVNALSPAAGGSDIALNTIYLLSDPNPGGLTGLGYSGFRPRIRTVSGQVKTIGNVSAGTLSSGTFTIYATQPGTNTYSTYTVTFAGTTPTDLVAAIQTQNIPNVLAHLESNGAISLTHLTGGTIALVPGTGGDTLLGAAGFSSGVANLQMLGTTRVLSGFTDLLYTPSTVQPTADPMDGTLWYYSDATQIDILINDGTQWKGYQNLSVDARGYALGNTDPTGVIVSASQPTTQSDNSSLVAGDLWLDTSDLEHFPKLSRYTGSSWIAIDNTDHITQNGIIFADARWDSNGTTDPVAGLETTTISLLTSNYIDADAPSAVLHPRGTLLFNTRRSGYNVKRWVGDYFNAQSFAYNIWSSSTTYTAGTRVIYGTTVYVATTTTTNNSPSTSPAYWTALQLGSWVTTSGLDKNGVMFAGHYAQRNIVVEALQAAINSNTQIREDQYKFTLIAAPGYPELVPAMVNLNVDRSQTAFVIGDTPLNLAPKATDLIQWSNGYSSDNGLTVDDPYVAVYYPAGLTTDLSGNRVMVPASHMALRTYLYNDNVAYPWFAPAGTHRGLVNNASDLGYLDEATGSFISTGISQAVRDTLYSVNINPITIMPGTGIVVWGQKTRNPSASSLDRVNVARLVNYIRTILASTSNGFLFEPNDKVTRDQLQQIISSSLNDLVAKRGIYDYLVVCDTSNNTPDRIARNELYVDIAIEPMKDVEFIYIPIRLLNPGSIGTSNLGNTAN